MPWPRKPSAGRTSGTCRAGTSNSRKDREEKNGRQRGWRMWEVAGVITNPTVGPDGCGGQVIYVRQGGAGQEEAPTDCGRQGPLEGIPPGQKSEETPKVLDQGQWLSMKSAIQKSTDLLICKLPFSHLVCEIALKWDDIACASSACHFESAGSCQRHIWLGSWKMPTYAPFT